MFCASGKFNNLLQLFSEDFVKFRFIIFSAILFLLGSFTTVSAQADTVIGQITSSAFETFVGGISGDGRFVVLESRGNIATENPRNADGNREVFLFDYAQRRIFQITDTKSLLVNTSNPPTNLDNVKVDIVNIRPVISNDGRWIAFSSNANSIAEPVAGLTPGNFNASALTNSMGENPLTQDGNTELWIYEIPPAAPVNLSLGEEIPFVNLGAGTFTRVTNTPASRLPVPGTTTTNAIVADDNRDASINDNGNYIAFVSNRDLDPCAGTPSATCGNAFPNFDNAEIFTYARLSNTVEQVTATPRGSISLPIFNAVPTISGNGLRIAFLSNANNPVIGMTGGNNADNNEEVFFTDLDASGAPAGVRRQVTATTATSPGTVVNVLNYGKRMSRDGRYIAFDSYAALETQGNPVQTSFALYLYDTTATMNAFRRIGPRSDADAAATGGDVLHYPAFTNYDGNGTPQTLVLETRLNIKPDGTMPTNSADGLNPVDTRPAQVYYIPIEPDPTFTRLTKLRTSGFFLGVVQPYTSDSLKRMSFNLSQTEVGTGNFDLQSEAYYMLTPVENTVETPASFAFATGASRIPVSNSPVPTPSPTATPTPTPTPSPSPSPTASPTPVTPPAVQGVSPGMLAIVNIVSGGNQPIEARTAVGSIQRSFELPIELSGVTMSVNGAAAGLKSVSQRQIVFVVPEGLAPSGETPYDVVINNNGLIMRGKLTVVFARPDIFTFNEVPAPGGRAKVFNATNRVLTREPFTVTTLRYRGGRRVPTVLRVHLTGVAFFNAAAFSIRIGDRTISGERILTGAVQVEPGVYTVDFTLPPELNGAGDEPIVVSIIFNGVTYSSRLDDTAPFVRIL